MQAMPLMGPGFDPERDIEEFSDDSSSDEDDDEDYPGQATEAEFAEDVDLDQFFMSTFGKQFSEPCLQRSKQLPSIAHQPAFVAISRRAAVSYMPIRINCLYG